MDDIGQINLQTVDSDRAVAAGQPPFRQSQDAVPDLPLQGQVVRGNGCGGGMDVHLPEGGQGRYVLQGKFKLGVQPGQQAIDRPVEQSGRGKRQLLNPAGVALTEPFGPGHDQAALPGPGLEENLFPGKGLPAAGTGPHLHRPLQVFRLVVGEPQISRDVDLPADSLGGHREDLFHKGESDPFAVQVQLQPVDVMPAADNQLTAPSGGDAGLEGEALRQLGKVHRPRLDHFPAVEGKPMDRQTPGGIENQSGAGRDPTVAQGGQMPAPVFDPELEPGGCVFPVRRIKPNTAKAALVAVALEVQRPCQDGNPRQNRRPAAECFRRIPGRGFGRGAG